MAVASLAFLIWRSTCETVTGLTRCVLGQRKVCTAEFHYSDTDLNRRVVERCEEAGLAEFSPAPWAPGPYSQTIFGNISRPKAVPYSRELVRMSDGVKVAVDWLAGQEDLPPETPILITLHGIAGSSEGWASRYLMAECQQRRWRGIAFNRRGHGGVTTEIEVAIEADGEEKLQQSRSHKCFPAHADIDDFEAVLALITARYPNAPVVAVGFSLGSNLLVRYLGEKGDQARLSAGISVSNGFDMMLGSKYLESHPYLDPLLASRLKVILKQNTGAMVAQGGVSQMEVKKLTSIRSVRNFDGEISRKFYGFDTVDDYYYTQSCGHVMQQIQRPTLLIVSCDDPICVPGHEAFAINAAESNPNVLAVVTETGGHLGWKTSKGNWMLSTVTEYMVAVADTLEPPAVGQGPPKSVNTPVERPITPPTSA